MTSDTRTSPDETQESEAPRHRRGGLAKREARLGVALILPAVLVVGLLVVFPLLWNISLSFQKARLINIREVSLVGFGTFSKGRRKARKGRNPQTGEAIKIKASTVVKFKAGKNLKDAI